MRNDRKLRPPALAEIVFDIAYLGTVLISGVLLWTGGVPGSERWEFGLMALILVAGDACHLLPRIHMMWDGRAEEHRVSLGAGKFAASITMTVFYVILWNIGAVHYPGLVSQPMTAAVYILAALRIALCLFPQNRWTSPDAPLKWSVWRNVPFFIQGMSVMALFATGSYGKHDAFSYLWILILLSFAFYLPVVLFTGKIRWIGMLMLPKSCAYVVIVLTGFWLSRS